VMYWPPAPPATSGMVGLYVWATRRMSGLPQLRSWDISGLSGAGRRFARSANAHLIDDETVAKMGHPDFVMG
jgi:hypothetical protein